MWNKFKGLTVASAITVAAVASPAHAAPVDLITNGNFSSTYSTGTASAATPSQLGLNGYGVTGWTSGAAAGGAMGYNFLFNPTLAGAAGYTSLSQYTGPDNTNTVKLYTSANGGSATAPASLISPVGGNFLAADGAFQPGAISQTVSGLSAGTDYTLSFYWAASQQAGFTGVTTDSWGVTFGNQSFTTATVTNPDKGFTPWTKVSFVTRATSASQVLSFLATGGPSGSQPPFALLDGVSLVATPEPATWAVMVGGLGLVGFMTARRRRRSAASTLAA